MKGWYFVYVISLKLVEQRKKRVVLHKEKKNSSNVSIVELQEMIMKKNLVKLDSIFINKYCFGFVCLLDNDSFPPAHFHIKMLNEFASPGVIFGHHVGDVRENVIANAMKGHGILEVLKQNTCVFLSKIYLKKLSGMGEASLINGVMIWRPVLFHEKDDIFDFAHQYGVP